MGKTLSAKKVIRKAGSVRVAPAPSRKSPGKALVKNIMGSPTKAVVEENVSGPSNYESRPVSGRQLFMTSTLSELDQMNKELLVRIQDLELRRHRELEGNAIGGGDQTEVAKESSSIIAMVKDLHEELDVAYQLKGTLEADLAAAKKKLSEEESTRLELEARGSLLETKVALIDQLRRDISALEKERDEASRRLGGVASKLEQAIQDRDGLAKQRLADGKLIEELKGSKEDLEDQVLELERSGIELDRIRKDHENLKGSHRFLEEKLQDVVANLDASKASRTALELELSATRENLHRQHEQIQDLKSRFSGIHAEAVKLREVLEKCEAENASLRESSKRRERENKALSVRYEAAQAGLANLKAQLEKQEARAINFQSASKLKDREIKALVLQNESMKREIDSGKRALNEIRTVVSRTPWRFRKGPQV